jgi:hypothetical protein
LASQAQKRSQKILLSKRLKFLGGGVKILVGFGRLFVGVFLIFCPVFCQTPNWFGFDLAQHSTKFIVILCIHRSRFPVGLTLGVYPQTPQWRPPLALMGYVFKVYPAQPTYI